MTQQPPANPILPTCRVDLAGRDSPLVNREWLLTNGLGGFAMGTAAGCNTRRYHGLLIAARRPPVDRFNTVNLIADQLLLDGQTHDLFTMQFTQPDGPPIFHPHGWKSLQRFEKDTACRWTFQVGPVRLTRQLRLVWKRHIALLTYRLDLRAQPDQPPPRSLSLQLTPLLSMRTFHGQRDDAGVHLFNHSVDQQTVTVTTWDSPTVQMAVDTGRFHSQPDTWYRVYYHQEAERHLPAVEQLYSPGRFVCPLEPTSLADGQAMEVRLMLATEPIDWTAADRPDPRVDMLAEQYQHLSESLAEPAGHDDLACLLLAANDFVVERRIDHCTMTTIIAGYPWFSDWGRDTFISLPGLLLCTGRYEQARDTLDAYAHYLRDGLIPNRFDDYTSQPHYNTVDASLWFIHAACRYLQVTGDQAFWTDRLERTCRDILHAYRQGTPPLIAMDDDGLIAAGSPETQLTWMDARCNGISFTPRHGKAVEINALWYHGLAAFNAATGRADGELAGLLLPVAKAFNRTFWLADAGYLADHVNDAGPDRSFRPNQVLAVSLEHCPLSQRRRLGLLRLATEKLLTPRGLRTLPPDDPNYHGQCSGSMFERDRAYHQGTVWPWLIGPYVEALLRAKNFSPAARRQARRAIAPLLQALRTDALGQLHEIYDGDPPHRPRGCIAQAWSVAELLRAALLIEAPPPAHR